MFYLKQIASPASCLLTPVIADQLSFEFPTNQLLSFQFSARDKIV